MQAQPGRLQRRCGHIFAPGSLVVLTNLGTLLCGMQAAGRQPSGTAAARPPASPARRDSTTTPPPVLGSLEMSMCGPNLRPDMG